MTVTVAAADPLVSYARQMLARGAKDCNQPHAYEMPFLRITTSANDAGFNAVCARVLACHPGQPAGDTLRVHTFEASSPPPLLDHDDAPAATGAFAIQRRLRAAGLCGALSAPGGIWNFYDPVAGEAVQVLRPRGGDPRWEDTAPLRLAMAWAYLATGRLVVHGAALGRADRGVLIPGKSGSGKSGTTLAGVLAGLDTAGDDYVLVEPTAHACQAWPLYRIAKQDPAGLDRLGLAERPGIDRVENWQGKIEIDIESLGDGRLSPLALRAIVLPHVCHRTKCRLVPVGAREALLALAPSSIFQLPGNAKSALGIFADLVRTLPAFRLELGTDPGEIGQALGDFIEGLA